MFWKNKVNCRFIVSLCLCLLIGLSFVVAAKAADVNPITGMTQAVNGTGLEKSPSLPVFVGNIVKGALGIVGVIFLVLVIYAGVMWMLARGDETKIKSARNIIVTSITGFIIVMVSYAITSFVVRVFMLR